MPNSNTCNVDRCNVIVRNCMKQRCSSLQPEYWLETATMMVGNYIVIVTFDETKDFESARIIIVTARLVTQTAQDSKNEWNSEKECQPARLPRVRLPLASVLCEACECREKPSNIEYIGALIEVLRKSKKEPNKVTQVIFMVSSH